MPIRGAQVKPDVSVVKAYQALADAQHNLELASRQLEMSTGGPSSNPLLAPRSGADLDQVSREHLEEALRQLSERNKVLLDILTKTQVDQQVAVAYRKALLQFLAGGLAGITARTCVAPVDRVKILMQTQHVQAAADGAQAVKYHSLFGSLRTIMAEEGVRGLWKSNLANVVRVAPYAATQFASYDYYKDKLVDESKKAESKVEQLQRRLLCGGLAGLTATTATHPLDVIRLRVATDKDVRGISDAFVQLIKEGGPSNLYRGWLPTVVSLCPFIAVNFTAFDTLKGICYPKSESKPPVMGTLALGAAAGLIAQSVCHPLDTIRRRMQMKGHTYKGLFDAIGRIGREEGLQGFYRGVVPNAVKIVPNNAIRFLVYTTLKDAFDCS